MARKQTNASNKGGRGATRMREFGYKAVTVWLDASETKLVQKAAEKAGMKLATYLRQRAVDSASIELLAK